MLIALILSLKMVESTLRHPIPPIESFCTSLEQSLKIIFKYSPQISLVRLVDLALLAPPLPMKCTKMGVPIQEPVEDSSPEMLNIESCQLCKHPSKESLISVDSNYLNIFQDINNKVTRLPPGAVEITHDLVIIFVILF